MRGEQRDKAVGGTGRGGRSGGEVGESGRGDRERRLVVGTDRTPGQVWLCGRSGDELAVTDSRRLLGRS